MNVNVMLAVLSDAKARTATSFVASPIMRADRCALAAAAVPASSRPVARFVRTGNDMLTLVAVFAPAVGSTANTPQHMPEKPTRRYEQGNAVVLSTFASPVSTGVHAPSKVTGNAANC